MRSFITLMKPDLILSFVVCVIHILANKSLLNQNVTKIFTCVVVFWKSYWFSSYIWVYDPFGVNSVYGVTKSQSSLFSFLYDIQLFQHFFGYFS